MLAWLAHTRLVRVLLALLVATALLAGAFLWRLQQGPIALAFLDARIAAAVSALAPNLAVTIERTELVRVGGGVALRVTGLKLARPDGTPLLSLPALTVRPSVSALLQGRVVITRVGVDDGELALTRTPEGTWLLGAGTGGAGMVMADLPGGSPAGSAPGDVALPLLDLTRTHVTIDDQRAGNTLDLTDGDVRLRARADGLDVTVRAALRLESAVPPVRGTLRLPVELTAAATREADGKLGPVTFALTGNGGELVPADDPGPPFVLTGLEATGLYLPAVETLRLQRVAAAVGDSHLDARASVLLGAAPMLALDGTVDALPMTALTRLWPPEQATTVRTWLMEHASEGTLRKCRVQLGLHAAPSNDASSPRTPAAADDPTAPKPNAYDIACDFDGVTAHYLPPMAPIRAARGAARLTAERLEVTVTRGEVGACAVERGTLAMDLTVDPPRAAIVADVRGASAAVLALVDAPPLQLVTPLGIVPQDLGGGSRVHAELTLPIKHDLKPIEVGVQANATLTAASLPPLLAGIGIADGALEVTTDGTGLTVTGTTALTGIPEVPGPVTLALTLAAEPGQKSPAGARLVTFALDGDGVAAHGSARVAGTTISTLTVDRLRLAGNDLAGSLRRDASGALTASVSGDRLDLAALLDDPRLKPGDGAAAASYDVTLKLGTVRATADTELRDVSGSVRGSGGMITALTLAGTLPPNGGFQATIDGPPSARRFQVTSDQAAAALRALGVPTEFAGGRLELNATTDERGPQAFLTGELALHDIRVVKAPILAKMLSLGSLAGFAALLDRREGITFSEGKVPFRWTAPRLELMGVRAVGGLGLTGDGVIDRGAGTCDVSGNVIPVYSLNTALGKVPVLNKLPIVGKLVGGDGQGIFGIAYRVAGTLPDPRVDVNPLRSVSPGVLRRWFLDPFTRRSPK